MKDWTPGLPAAGLEPLTADEQALLGADECGLPVPPARERLLAAAYAANETETKETQMIPNLVTRLFTGRSAAVRLALGAACLVALVALSLVLPRGGGISPVGTAWAAAEGYMLAFDFGEGSTQEQVQPLLDQLHAKVTAFKAAHDLPVDQVHKIGTFGEKRIVKRVEKHGDGPGTETSAAHSRVVVMVALPDAGLLDQLKAELATIPGLPTPVPTDATWFTENGLPDPDKPGINLSLNFDFDGEGKSHVFYFPETATEAQIESEINGWLAANKPDFQGTVDVTLSRTDGRTELRVEIKSTKNATDVKPSAG
jgi:hypothetical protein